MRSSLILQLSIFFIVIISCVIIYFSFFTSVDYTQDIKHILKKEDETKTVNIIVENNSESNDDASIIKNLEYNSVDSLGNKYLIKSNSAESSMETEGYLKLIDVNATIYPVGKSPIYITSKFALHNKKSFDTKFYDNVNISFEELDVDSGNLDLLYSDNLVTLYNIENARYKNSKLIADRMNFDILTRDISINMFDKNQKIKLIYK